MKTSVLTRKKCRTREASIDRRERELEYAIPARSEVFCGNIRVRSRLDNLAGRYIIKWMVCDKKGGGGRWRYIIVERWHREKESGRSERARQGWNEEIYNVQARLLPNSNERLWLVGKGLDKDRIQPITPRIITHRPMGSVLSANVPGQFDLAVFAIDLTHVSRWSPR